MLDLSTPKLRPSESPSLLGTADRTLALRVCGGVHRGRVIQIRSPKCTVGSAIGCTLRLRAIGVRPLHCWILRGPSGTVVRRRCGGSLLNGQAYEDAPLAMGDRLRIGTVELEVVECQPSPPPVMATVTQRFPEEPRLENREKVRELETLLTAAHEEIARLEADAQQAWQTSITAAERAEQLRVALERANVESGEVRGELETAQSALESERQQLRPELESLRQQLTEARQELSSNAESLARSERELAEQAARFASEREALERQIKLAQSELEQARAQAGPQASQMTMTMDQVRAATQAAPSEDWKSRYSALDDELRETRHELAAARKERDAADEWRSKFLEADRQVERWQAEADSRRTQIEELQSQLAELEARQITTQEAAEQAAGQQAAGDRQELERTRQEIEEQRQQLEAKQLELDGLQSQLSAQRLEVDALREQLDQQRSELASQREELAAREEKINEAHRGLVEFEDELKRGREALDSERAAQQSALDEQAARLQQQTDLLSDQANELAARQAELDRAREQLAQAEADLESRQESFIVQEAELEASRVAFEADRAEFDRQREAAADGTEDSPQHTLVGDFSSFAAESLEAEEANRQDCADESPDMEMVDSVLSRLVQSGLWRGDREEPSSEAVSHEPVAEERADQEQEEPGIAEEDSSAQATEEPLPQASAPTMVGSAETSDEESIEKYMERLMQRVRGDSTSGARPPLAAVFQAAAEQARPAQRVPAPEADAPQPVKPEEYVPRSQAPEQSQNLAAMRELANSAARSAIEKHHQKSHGKQAAGRLLGAGIVLLGSALLGYWAWHSHSVAAGVGAAIGLLTGTLWALRGLGRLLNSLKLTHPPAAPMDAESPDETPLAATIDDAVPMDAAPLDPANLEAAAPVEALDSEQPAAGDEVQPPV